MTAVCKVQERNTYYAKFYYTDWTDKKHQTRTNKGELTTTSIHIEDVIYLKIKPSKPARP